MNPFKELNRIQRQHKGKTPATDAAMNDLLRFFTQYLSDLASKLTAKQEKQKQQQHNQSTIGE